MDRRDEETMRGDRKSHPELRLHLEPHPGLAAATRLLDRGSLNVSLQISVAKFQYGRTFNPSVSKRASSMASQKPSFSYPMPVVNPLPLFLQVFKKLVCPPHPILKSNSLNHLLPLLTSPLRLIQIPLHHGKKSQINRSNRAPFVTFRRPFRRLYRRRKR